MNTTKKAKTFLIIAAIMQLIYFISAVVILKCPSIVLFLCGHSGGYDLPFDSICEYYFICNCFRVVIHNDEYAEEVECNYRYCCGGIYIHNVFCY